MYGPDEWHYTSWDAKVSIFIEKSKETRLTVPNQLINLI